MSVAGSISGALRRFGRPMTLRRIAVGPAGTQIPLDVTVYGRTKGYAPAQLVGGLVEGDIEVTITNAEIAQAQWPGPPRMGDRMVIDGLTRTIFAPVEAKHLGSEVLVYVCQVRG